MLSPRLLVFVLALAAALFGGSEGAAAQSVTVENSPPTQTLVESYSTGCADSNGCASNSFFSDSSYWGANINPGGENSTSGLTVSYTAGDNVSTFGTVTLTFNTTFAETCASTCGIDPVTSSQNAYAADIFIDTSAPGDPANETFDYAIALGYTNIGDGGLAEGLYAGSYGAGSAEDLTSTQVWGQTDGGGYYGGAFAAGSDCSGTPTSCSEAVAPPTVATGTSDDGNAPISGITVADAWNYSASDPTDDTLTVTLTATTSDAGTLLANVFDDFDIFWGTGDNSDAPLWGDPCTGSGGSQWGSGSKCKTAQVPEPSSLALFLGSGIALILFRRRKRILSTAA